MENKKSGFVLITLIVIVLLGAILIPLFKLDNFFKTREKSKIEKKEEKTSSEKILEYLRNQYNEEFELLSIYHHSDMLQSYDLATVYPKSMGEEYKFLCELQSNGTYSDTYFQVLNKDKIKEKLKKIIGNFDKNAKCILFSFFLDYEGTGIGNKMSADEAIKETEITLRTYFITTSKYSKEQIDNIFNAFKEINYSGSIKIYSIQDKTFYSKVNALEDFNIYTSKIDKNKRVKATVFDLTFYEKEQSYEIKENYYMLMK